MKTNKQQAQHKSTWSCHDNGVCCCCRHRTHSSRGTSNSGRKMEVIDVVVAFAVAAVIVHASNSIERRMRVRGGDNVAEAQKGGDARVGMKKQPVLETKNREAGGSSPEKPRRGVPKKRLAQTEIRHAHFGVEISGPSICSVFPALFGRDVHTLFPYTTLFRSRKSVV